MTLVVVVVVILLFCLTMLRRRGTTRDYNATVVGPIPTRLINYCLLQFSFVRSGAKAKALSSATQMPRTIIQLYHDFFSILLLKYKKKN